MDNELKLEAIKGVISSLFASQRALRVLAPDYRWAGLEYYGPFDLVDTASRYSTRDNKKMISLSKLRAIKQALATAGAAAAKNVANTIRMWTYVGPRVSVFSRQSVDQLFDTRSSENGGSTTFDLATALRVSPRPMVRPK